MDSNFVLSQGDNRVMINGREVLNENWLGKYDGRKLNVKYRNNDNLIHFNVNNRELMDHLKKKINSTTNLPLAERIKRNDTTRKYRKVKDRTPTPYPKKTRYNIHKKKKKKKKKKN